MSDDMGSLEIGIVVASVLTCIALVTMCGWWKFSTKRARRKYRRLDDGPPPQHSPRFLSSSDGEDQAPPPPVPQALPPLERTLSTSSKPKLKRDETTNYAIEFEDIFLECKSHKDENIASKNKFKDLLAGVMSLPHGAARDAVDAVKNSRKKAGLDRKFVTTVLRLLSLHQLGRTSSLDALRVYPGGEESIPPPRIDRAGDPLVRMVLPDPSVVPDLTPSFPITNYIIDYELLYLECAVSELSPTCSAEKVGNLLDRVLPGCGNTTVKAAKTCWKLAGDVHVTKDRERFYMAMRFVSLHQLGQPPTLEALYAFPGGTWSIPPPLLVRSKEWEPVRGYRGDDVRLHRARKYRVEVAPPLLLDAPPPPTSGDGVDEEESDSASQAAPPSPRTPRPKCDECQTKVASRKCLDCDLSYCEACLAERHSKGKLARHVFEEVGLLRRLTTSSARCPQCHALSKLCICPKDTEGEATPARCDSCGALENLCVCRSKPEEALCQSCGGTYDLCNCAVFSPDPEEVKKSEATRSKRSKSKSKSKSKKGRSKSKSKRATDEVDSDDEAFGQL